MKYSILLLLILSFKKSNSQDLGQQRLPCIHKTFYIAYHPVQLGTSANFPNNYMDTGIILVNKLLEPICVEFKVLDTFRVTNYNYNIDPSKLDLTKEYFRDEMARMHNINKVINLYHLEIQQSYEEAGICMNDSKTPFISISNHTQINTFALNLSRLLLNYLGLKLTYFTPQNKELVNGTNSLTSADLIFETPADPFAILNPPIDPTISVTNGIQYFDYDKKDANDSYYSPMIYNIMSMYPSTYFEACNKLTYQQYDYLVKKIISCP